MLIRLIPIALLLLFESSAFAGQWTRLSPEVLSFEGIIEEKVELQKLVENWDDRINKLIVNSPGGNTVTGILMGNFLADKKFDIDVQGQCMSACANYLFITAKQKIISKGVVGFHGNATASLYKLQKRMSFHSKEDFTEVDFATLESFFEGKSKKLLLDFYTEYVITAEIEKNLFNRLGVSQQLFDRSQLHDKGMNDGKLYSFLLPRSETFIKYGIENVIGNQSLEILQTWPVFIENASFGYDVIID